MDWYTLTEALTPLLATLLVTLVSWGVYELKQYVRSKTQNQMTVNAVDSITDAANTIVAELKATVVDELKKAGPLDKAKAQKIKEIAVTKTKAMLTDQTVKVASKTIADLDTFIAGKIEKAVTESKTTG